MPLGTKYVRRIQRKCFVIKKQLSGQLIFDESIRIKRLWAVRRYGSVTGVGIQFQCALAVGGSYVYVVGQ
jgi:hypothetical protein